VLFVEDISMSLKVNIDIFVFSSILYCISLERYEYFHSRIISNLSIIWKLVLYWFAWGLCKKLP